MLGNQLSKTKVNQPQTWFPLLAACWCELFALLWDFESFQLSQGCSHGSHA
jgi:hypothetical protein